jgi:hypothetical protein
VSRISVFDLTLRFAETSLRGVRGIGRDAAHLADELVRQLQKPLTYLSTICTLQGYFPSSTRTPSPKTPIVNDHGSWVIEPSIGPLLIAPACHVWADADEPEVALNPETLCRDRRHSQMAFERHELVGVQRRRDEDHPK